MATEDTNAPTIKLNVSINTIKGRDQDYCSICNAYGEDKEHAWDGYLCNIDMGLGKPIQRYICCNCLDKLWKSRTNKGE